MNLLKHMLLIRVGLWESVFKIYDICVTHESGEESGRIEKWNLYIRCIRIKRNEQNYKITHMIKTITPSVIALMNKKYFVRWFGKKL